MRICIYGAASDKVDKKYLDGAEMLGMSLAKNGHGLVFGGGATGLMGAAARGAQREDGEIIGIAPTFFNQKGVLFETCTQLIFTETMRERKQLMEEKADAFIMMPGGIGTFEEFFEILTLKQLHRHDKPIAVYNIDGYYDKLLAFLEQSRAEKFLDRGCQELFGVCETPEELLKYLSMML